MRASLRGVYYWAMTGAARENTYFMHTDRVPGCGAAVDNPRNLLMWHHFHGLIKKQAKYQLAHLGPTSQPSPRHSCTANLNRPEGKLWMAWVSHCSQNIFPI